MAFGNVATLTVDGFVGAGIAIQAKVFSNIKSFAIDAETNILTMVDTSNKVMRVALNAPATMTVTISNGNYAVTIAD